MKLFCFVIHIHPHKIYFPYFYLTKMLKKLSTNAGKYQSQILTYHILILYVSVFLKSLNQNKIKYHLNKRLLSIDQTEQNIDYWLTNKSSYVDKLHNTKG